MTESQVTVTFTAPADTFEQVVGPDVFFHERHGQLRVEHIRVEGMPIFVDLVPELPPGLGTRDKPFELDPGQCAICLTSPDEPIALRCQHEFCRNCIQHWYRPGASARANKTCPVCRAPIRRADVFSR